MALTPRRHRFGASSADTTQSVGEGNAAIFEPAHTLWVYDAKTGGTRLTDLSSDAAGTLPITEVVSGASGGIPEFYGPLDVTDLWISSASGASPEANERTLLAASDLKTDIDALDAAVDGVVIEAGVQTINGIPPDASGDVDLAPESLSPAAATQAEIQELQDRIYVARVVQVGGGYPPRPSDADYVDWVGTLDPAPSAIEGDEWHYPDTSGS